LLHKYAWNFFYTSPAIISFTAHKSRCKSKIMKLTARPVICHLWEV
jgi:hypothetical protein